MIRVENPGQVILDVRNLDCFYKDLQVLTQASLKLYEGKVTALFGPNGHGKSTLLKAICGLHPPASGSIEFRGAEIVGLPTEYTVEKGLAYIPEDRNIFPDMTVRENLRLGAFVKHARKNIDESFGFVFSLFPRLKERQNQFASTLSGGESRMLAVGRGLMSRASVLLIDEPSIGLSPLLKKQVFEAIGQINQEAGTAILIVEQEVDYPLKMASKVYLLRKGRIILEVEADQISKAQITKAYFE